MHVITVVIPTYNQKERLSLTLGALSKQTVLTSMSVIVVDDGSTDGTKELLDSLEYDWLNVVQQKNMGRSIARNNGIGRVQSEFVLLLDDDIIVAPTFVENHLHFQQSQKGVCIGEIYNIPPEHVEHFIATYEQSGLADKLAMFQQEDLLVNLGRYFFNTNPGLPISWVCMVAANVSFPVRLFDHVNGFDPQFKGWGVEDHELAFRFYQAGATFHFLNQAVVFHLDHYKEIDRTELLENVVYFYKKYAAAPEVKAYVDYVTSKTPMAALYEAVMNGRAESMMNHIYFRPNAYLLNKRGK